MEGVAPGIDVRFRVARGSFEYDLLVSPGSDLAALTVRCDNAAGMRIAADGALVIETPAGDITQPRPLAWEIDADGASVGVACSYVILGQGRYGFLVEERSQWRELVIDPGLEWSTYLGGSGDDDHLSVATDASGRVLVAGTTWSLDLPTTTGAFQPVHAGGGLGNPRDAFFGRLSLDASRFEFLTYLGGESTESSIQIRTHEKGDLFVAGSTSSPDFPITSGSWDEEYALLGDVFVSIFSSNGTALVHSTYLGTNKFERVSCMDVVDAGDVVLCGSTSATDFPTTPGAFSQWSGNGHQSKVFVTRLNGTLSDLVHSSVFAGEIGTTSKAMAVAPDGRVAVGGRAYAADFPTTPGALATLPPDELGAYITILSPTGALEASTFLPVSGAFDTVLGLAFGPDGNLVFMGVGGSSNLPTTPGVFQPFNPTQSGLDSFVGALDPTLGTLAFLTYVGGVNDSLGGSLHVDSGGVITVAGLTRYLPYPATEGAYSNTTAGLPGGFEDFYVTRLSPDVSRLYYSTFLGGSLREKTSTSQPLSLVPAETGSMVLAGITLSKDFPTTPGVVQPSAPIPAEPANFNQADGVVIKLDLLPTGVEKVGLDTPGCRGALTLGVMAMPRVGSTQFGLWGTGAPGRGAMGLLAVGRKRLEAPELLEGAALWVDPDAVDSWLPLDSNRVGFFDLLARVPDHPGETVYVQAFWLDDCAPGGVSATQALAITIQP